MNKHLSSIKKTAVLVAVSWLAMPAFAGIGGFIDAQVGGSKNVNLNSEIADAAVYLSKELGRGKMMVDLPFSFAAANANVNTFGGAATPGAALVAAGYDSAFRAFNTKAQAYVNWSYDFGLSWQLGRFDSPFLNEANDTVGLGPYATQGTVFDLLPRMHNGLMLTYGTGPVSVMGIVSRDAGTVGAKADGERFEYAVLGKYTHDMMYVGAGYYTTHKARTAATDDADSTIEVMAGTKVSDWTIDAQAVFVKTAGVADSGMGLGATLNYAWDKTWTFGIRPNYTSKISGADAHDSRLELTVGPHMSLTDDFKVRANYTYTSTKATAGANANNDSAYTLSAVYKF